VTLSRCQLKTGVEVEFPDYVLLARGLSQSGLLELCRKEIKMVETKGKEQRFSIISRFKTMFSVRDPTKEAVEAVLKDMDRIESAWLPTNKELPDGICDRCGKTKRVYTVATRPSFENGQNVKAFMHYTNRLCWECAHELKELVENFLRER